MRDPKTTSDNLCLLGRCPDLSHLLIGEARISSALSLGGSSFRYPIGNVVELRAEKQMIKTNAKRLIASVEHPLSRWNWADA